MPDRVIRDELLTSERYWSVSIEAQRLFFHLLLRVDDRARFTAKNYSVRAACFPGQAVNPERLEKMLIELSDADLVRLYVVENERFLFVPRFRNRQRYVGRAKYPDPPPGISDLPSEKSDCSPTEARPTPDRSSTEDSLQTRGVGVGVEVGEEKTSGRRAQRAGPVSLKVFMERCRATGEKPVPLDHSVFKLAEEKGIPSEFIDLAWMEFKRQHLPEGSNESTRKTDWRRHFHNAVDKRWQRLWWFNPNGGACELTSDGQQAMRMHRKVAMVADVPGPQAA